MADIFVSYASADRDRARLLAEHLSQHGYTVWWDRTIPPGRVFDEVIQEALDAAACVIVLWSKTSVASNWVKAESSDALTHNRLVPSLIEKVSPPIEFRRIQAADLTDWQGEEDHAEYLSLLASVARLIKTNQSNKVADIKAADIAEKMPHAAVLATSQAWNAKTPAPMRVVQLTIAAVLAVVVLSMVMLKTRGSKSQQQVLAADNVSSTPVRSDGGDARSDTVRSERTVTQTATASFKTKGAQTRVNLLSPDNGGQLLVAASDKWGALVDGKEDAHIWIDAGIGVFGFADGKAATFDTFAVLIPGTYDYNLKDFELYAGNEAPTGHFDLIGKFSAQNVRMVQQPYQEFHFAPVTAKYFKFHTLNNQAGSNSAVLAYEFQLFGHL